MRIFQNDKQISKRAAPTLEGLRHLYREANNDLQYIEGSRTYDTVRYGSMPFVLRFSDRHNNDWKIEVTETHDDFSICIPCGPQILWYGGNDSPTRTGSDAQTDWAQVQFSYTGGNMFQCAGIRIQFNGYKEKNASEWTVNKERWETCLEMAKKGTEITGAVLDQIEQGTKIAKGM